MTRMVSPQSLHNAACTEYLNGRAPHTNEEWEWCVNFWAANIATAEVEASQLMGMIFDCPLSRDHIAEIARFQQTHKAQKRKHA